MMHIKIDGIICNTIIGCYEYERNIKQDLIVDVLIELNHHDWLSEDKLEDTVNYDDLADYIKTIVNETKYKLLESLLQHIADKLLERYSVIKGVHIDIVKPAICGVKAQGIKVSFVKERQFRVALTLGSNSHLPQQQLITAIELLMSILVKLI